MIAFADAYRFGLQSRPNSRRTQSGEMLEYDFGPQTLWKENNMEMDQ